MRKLIIPWGGFSIILTFLSVIFLLEAAGAKTINDYSEPQEIVVTTIEVVGGTSRGVRLSVEYEGEIFFNDNPEVVLSYIKNPGPMQGTRYASGLIVLEPRQ